MKIRTCISGVGTYLPPQKVTSNELFEDIQLEKNYGISNTWMSDTMGIHERRISSSDTMPSDLATKAALKALANTSTHPAQIDMVIFCGIEKDQSEPATAHHVHRNLGLKAKYVFDTTNACFGFLDGIEIADAFIQSGRARAALIVTGETQFGLIDSLSRQLKQGTTIERARKMLGFFSLGDAGGAMVLDRGDSKDGVGFDFFNNDVESKHADKCYYRPMSDGEYDGQMLMSRIVAHGFKMQTDMVWKTLKAAGWSKFDWLLTHQTGRKNFEQVASLGVAEPDRMVKTYDFLGNITSATLPVTVDKLLSSGAVRKGEHIGGCFGGSGLVVGQFGYTM